MKNVREMVQQKNSSHPEKILQFGEGNFLRAFADWMIDTANDEGYYNGSIALCQPIKEGEQIAEIINRQEGIYTLVMRGIEEKEPVEKSKIITSVKRCINAYRDYEALMDIAKSEELQVVISNTTEAGISYKEGDKLSDCPPSSFPGKVCKFLYERYQFFKGDQTKGLLFLPVELIDNNGTQLKKIVLQYAKEWELEEEFVQWLLQSNKFANTLVDRIVTGYPRDQMDYFTEKLGYEDDILVTSELFHLWVIEGEKEWAEQFPIDKSGVNIIWTEDVTPYKMRKVRILNGSHTSIVLAAYLAGHNIVLDFMQDPLFVEYFDHLVYDEVIPTIPLKEQELIEFADAVKDRFLNPYIKHNLLDISLNSCSKFKARCLPSMMAYIEKKQELPKWLVFSMAAFIRFYKGEMTDGKYMGVRADKTTYQIKDDEENLVFFNEVWKNNSTEELVLAVLKNESLWDSDLSTVEGLKEALSGYLDSMEQKPMQEVIKDLL